MFFQAQDQLYRSCRALEYRGDETENSKDRTEVKTVVWKPSVRDTLMLGMPI
jgi:hypothetical protein